MPSLGRRQVVVGPLLGRCCSFLCVLEATACGRGFSFLLATLLFFFALPRVFRMRFEGDISSVLRSVPPVAGVGRERFFVFNAGVNVADCRVPTRV